jgi:hypothetical protein
MRGLVAGFVLALAVLLSLPAAEAKSNRRSMKHAKPAKAKHATRPARAEARALRLTAVRERDRVETRVLARGQSVGAPWAGRLQHATELPPSDSYFIRRPGRAFGTETTVAFVERAIAETFDAFPDTHVLAIGDLSAPSGGQITEHRSHQSGRDVDVGLFYLEQPARYPASFVPAGDDNLDCAATFKLLESFLASTNDDGGVQVIFLDFDVQGALYAWAQDQGISERRLERIFQYPHGYGASEGLVRHEPNHDDHMHVRFKCPSDDTACR